MGQPDGHRWRHRCPDLRHGGLLAKREECRDRWRDGKCLARGAGQRSRLRQEGIAASGLVQADRVKGGNAT